MQLGHADVGASAAPIVEVGTGPRPLAAAVVEGVAVVGHRLIVGEDRPAFTAANVLAHLETETARRAPASQAAVPPAAQNRLAGVLDHRHVALLGDSKNTVQIGRGSANVHGDDRRRALRDRRLELGRVHLERLAIGIDEDRHGVVQHGDVHRGAERVRRHDDLVTGTNPQRPQRRVQGAGAAADGHAVLRAVHQRKGPLELLHGPVAVPAAGVDDLQHRLLVRRGHDGPGWVAPGMHGLPAQQRRLRGALARPS